MSRVADAKRKLLLNALIRWSREPGMPFVHQLATALKHAFYTPLHSGAPGFLGAKTGDSDSDSESDSDDDGRQRPDKRPRSAEDAQEQQKRARTAVDRVAAEIPVNVLTETWQGLPDEMHAHIATILMREIIADPSVIPTLFDYLLIDRRAFAVMQYNITRFSRVTENALDETLEQMLDIRARIVDDAITEIGSITVAGADDALYMRRRFLVAVFEFAGRRVNVARDAIDNEANDAQEADDPAVLAVIAVQNIDTQIEAVNAIAFSSASDATAVVNAARKHIAYLQNVIALAQPFMDAPPPFDVWSLCTIEEKLWTHLVLSLMSADGDDLFLTARDYISRADRLPTLLFPLEFRKTLFHLAFDPLEVCVLNTTDKLVHSSRVRFHRLLNVAELMAAHLNRRIELMSINQPAHTRTCIAFERLLHSVCEEFRSQFPWQYDTEDTGVLQAMGRRIWFMVQSRPAVHHLVTTRSRRGEGSLVSFYDSETTHFENKVQEYSEDGEDTHAAATRLTRSYWSSMGIVVVDAANLWLCRDVEAIRDHVLHIPGGAAVVQPREAWFRIVENLCKRWCHYFQSVYLRANDLAEDDSRLLPGFIKESFGIPHYNGFRMVDTIDFLISVDNTHIFHTILPTIKARLLTLLLYCLNTCFHWGLNTERLENVWKTQWVGVVARPVVQQPLSLLHNRPLETAYIAMTGMSVWTSGVDDTAEWLQCGRASGFDLTQKLADCRILMTFMQPVYMWSHEPRHTLVHPDAQGETHPLRKAEDPYAIIDAFNAWFTPLGDIAYNRHVAPYIENWLSAVRQCVGDRAWWQNRLLPVFRAVVNRLPDYDTGTLARFGLWIMFDVVLLGERELVDILLQKGYPATNLSAHRVASLCEFICRRTDLRRAENESFLPLLVERIKWASRAFPSEIRVQSDTDD